MPAVFRSLLLAVTLLYLSWSAAAVARPANPTLDAYFHALVTERHFNGGILVVDHGKVVFERVHGKASLSPPAPLTRDTRFAYASISKLFTATAILQLVEAGKLDLDVPVARYLPGFPYPAITPRHLLTHSSGLPVFSTIFGPGADAEPARTFTNADFVPGLARNPVPLLYAPGTRSNYDNINFTVLALLVEQASGEPYPAYIARHILRPARMTQTRFLPISKQMQADHVMPGLAAPYMFPTRYAEAPLLSTTIPYARRYAHSYAFNGFGDYVGTMRDLSRFAAAYDRLVGPGLRAQAFAVSRMSDGSPHPNKIGLSWYVGGDETRGKLVFHAGVMSGLSCILVRAIEKQQTIIVFSNMQPDVNGIAFDVTRLLNGQAVDLPRRSLATAYVHALLREGPAVATALLERLGKDPRYVLDEGELNVIGYDLLSPGDPYRFGLSPKLGAALETFRTNLARHPQSWNAHDSYGEALRKAGRRQEAIAMYRRSLELHENAGGRRALNELLRGEWRQAADAMPEVRSPSTAVEQPLGRADRR